MIEFANPAALWFLSLIIPVVLLYLLKRRRQDRIVPSTYLWKQALEDTQASTPFQKLRSNLLLLLQILIVVLLTALLSQPYLATPFQESRQWILVMDRSASMQATDEKPNRFEAARKKLTAVLESVPSEDEIMLLALGSRASILHNFTSNHNAIEQRLHRLEPEDVSARWEDLFSILKPLLKRSPKPKLVIVSDFANVPTSIASGVDFDVIRIGQKAKNVAITRAVIEQLPGTTQEQLIFLQVKNFSAETEQTGVEVRQDQELLDAFDLRFNPQESAEKTVRVSVSKRSRFEIRLQTDDAFALDNDFVLIAEPRKKIAVQDEAGNAFLTRALRVLPFMQIAAPAPIRISQQIQQTPGLYFSSGGNKEPVTITQWNASAPQLRFVDAGLWRIWNYDLLQPPAGADSLLETQQGIVGYAVDQSGKRRIVLGFQIENSNLPLLAGFPIFIGNALEWIHSGLEPDRPTVTNRDLPKEGEIQGGYVNFADAAESDLTPAAIRAHSVSETRASILRKDFSIWFLLALLAIVILEWWVFHRKEFA